MTNASSPPGSSESPPQRPAQPEELARAPVHLASNADSSDVTGAILPVTGSSA